MNDGITIVLLSVFFLLLGVVFYRYLTYGIHLNYRNYHIVQFIDGKYAVRRGFIFKEYLKPEDRWISIKWISKYNPDFHYTKVTLDEAHRILDYLIANYSLSEKIIK